MTAVLESMARAIAERRKNYQLEATGKLDPAFVADARAALIALRDGVTPGMKAAGAQCGPDHDEEGSMDDDGSTYRYLSTQGAEDVLRAILNHVLQEGEKA